MGRLEVDHDGRVVHGPQGRPELVNRPSLESIAGQKQFPNRGGITGANMNVFNRLTLRLGQNLGCPRMLPPTVGWREGMTGDSEAFQHW